MIISPFSPPLPLPTTKVRNEAMSWRQFLELSLFKVCRKMYFFLVTKGRATVQLGVVGNERLVAWSVEDIP